MTGFVYRWTNLVNQKQYIGSHKGTPDDGYRHSSAPLTAAEKKYGIENFVREILFEGHYEKDKIKDKEAEYLNYYDAANNPMFYNQTNRTGARCFSLESRKKISEKNKGRLTGKKNPFYGKTHSQAVKKKLSNARKGKTWEEVYGKERAKQLRQNHPLKGKTYEQILGAEKSKTRRMTGDKNPSARKEVKEKISKSWESRRLISCPHCNVQSKNASLMNRWHFENCRVSC